MTPPPAVIAIDGPAASGKSTVGKLVAGKLQFLFFDTGALYRAVTLAALRRDIPVENEARICDLAHNLRIDMFQSEEDDGRPYTVLVDGEDVTWDLRREEVDAHVSTVSAYPGVREALKHKQRRIAQQGKVVMAGRDIGTVVFPEAPLKIYLDASPEERALRRCEELKARGETANFDEVLSGVRHRDQIDSTREAAPLKIAPDAVVIDTDHLPVKTVVDIITKLAQERLHLRPAP